MMTRFKKKFNLISITAFLLIIAPIMTRGSGAFFVGEPKLPSKYE